MKLIDFIICDDIRFETSGKNTLIGVYGDMNFTYKKGEAKPENVIYRMGVFIRCLIDEKDQIPDSFQLILIHSKKGALPPINGTLVSKEGIKLFNIAIVNNILLHTEGIITFKLTFKKMGKEISSLVPDYNLEVNFVEI